MSEINKIGLPKLDTSLQSGKNKNESIVEGEAFENQLMKTVKKLESMGNEVDAMMEAATLVGSSPIKRNANSMEGYLNKVDSIVENFSAASRTSSKSAKFVAAQYEQFNSKKGS